MGRADWVSIALFAIVLNMRPNAGLVPLALWLGRRGWRFVDMVKLGVAFAALFVGALGAAHALYPAYTLTAFRHGLGDYAGVYVLGGLGLAYGSSLWGAFKSLSLLSQGWLLAATEISAGVYAFGLIAARRGRMSDSGLMFVTAASYSLISEVFAD